MAKIREKLKPTLATGHLHVSMLQETNNEDFSNTKTSDLLSIIKKEVKEGIKKL